MLRGPEGGASCPPEPRGGSLGVKKLAGAQRNWSLDAGTGPFTSVPTSASMTVYSSWWLDLGFLGVGDGVARHLLCARARFDGFYRHRTPGSGNNLANAQARAPLPILILWRIEASDEGSTGPRTGDSTSKSFPGSSPLIPWHTKKQVSRDGVPPEPACATVADSVRIPITASALRHRFAFHDVPSLLARFSSPCRSRAVRL